MNTIALNKIVLYKNIWKFEMIIKIRNAELAIGVIDTNILDNFPFDKDIEFYHGFYGFYYKYIHSNFCWNGKRAYEALFPK